MSIYKYRGDKTVLKLKKDISQELERINGFPTRFEELPVDKTVGKKYGKYREQVKGFKMVFSIESTGGLISRYEITSQNGYDTITNMHLIYKNIKQRVVDIINKVISIESGFNDLKLLPIESESDPYKILGGTAGMSNEELKVVYKEMAQRYHPDHAGKEMEGFFQLFQRAWERIKRERGIE